MQYLVLIYSAESARPPAPSTPEEHAAMMAPWMAYGEAMSKAGVMVAGDALHPTETATTVCVENGETLITDGPFAETKEQLGGYYLIECANLDEAIGWAAKCPAVHYGRCEVRPVMDFSQA